jgi:serine/threonine protein kinase
MSSFADVTSPADRLANSPYLAPEVRNMTHPLNVRSEVWSLGAILYHMMVGHPPIPVQEGGDNPLIVREKGQHYFVVEPLPDRYSEGLKRIVYKMLRYIMEERPTADEIWCEIDPAREVWSASTIIAEGMPNQ